MKRTEVNVRTLVDFISPDEPIRLDTTLEITDFGTRLETYDLTLEATNTFEIPNGLARGLADGVDNEIVDRIGIINGHIDLIRALIHITQK